MKIKLSELIAKYGDEKVIFQVLDDATIQTKTKKDCTQITFETLERMHFLGMEKLGLVVWLDRLVVDKIIKGDCELKAVPNEVK